VNLYQKMVILTYAGYIFIRSLCIWQPGY